jgi:hypothetical protein
MKPAICPICHHASADESLDFITNRHAVSCHRCGRYGIERVWADRLRRDRLKLTERQAANASGYLRENQGYLITEADVKEDFGFLRQLRQPSVVERATKLLRYCARRFPEIGMNLHIKDFMMHGTGTSYSHDAATHPDKWDVDALLGYTWSATAKEVHYLFSEVLDKTLHFISNDRISPAGWLALDQAATRTDDALAFVAMCFKDSLKPVYQEAIYPAITAAGYKCERMDLEEHTERIDDKMMADIRRAKFLVADLTEHRPNVYFEAGLALGHGKQVIFLVRCDAKASTHFDVRQFPYIDWSPDDLPALRERLKNRILGSSGLGQGPIPLPATPKGNP